MGIAQDPKEIEGAVLRGATIYKKSLVEEFSEHSELLVSIHGECDEHYRPTGFVQYDQKRIKLEEMKDIVRRVEAKVGVQITFISCLQDGVWCEQPNIHTFGYDTSSILGRQAQILLWPSRISVDKVRCE